VYDWQIPRGDTAPEVFPAIVPLSNLGGRAAGARGLHGRFVVVHNAAVVPRPGPKGPQRTPLGDAEPDDFGHFLYDPGRGGGRVDKALEPDPAFLERYVQAARFGEVNTYHHLDRAGAYVDELLDEIGAASLPRVTAVVNAHAAAMDEQGGRDGRRCPDGRWVPFQGGHYRLPGPAAHIGERAPLSPDGEIHLGPGQKLAPHGALARLVGGPYRANASHNPGIIFHEYGHHICRHTADFSANRLRPRDRQRNRKTALDEGTADYWAASLLGTPHIWFFHHRHDRDVVHRRSLLSPRTMDSYVRGRAGDAHANGTIWAAALWDVRTAVARRASRPDTHRAADRLVLQALLLIGSRAEAAPGEPTGDARQVARRRRSFRRAAGALLEADAVLYNRALRDVVARALADRGIHPEGSVEPGRTNEDGHPS
jgi:hypothetical protein